MTNLGTTDVTFMEIVHGCAEESGETGRACVELVMDMPFEKVRVSCVWCVGVIMFYRFWLRDVSYFEFGVICELSGVWVSMEQLSDISSNSIPPPQQTPNPE